MAVPMVISVTPDTLVSSTRVQVTVVGTNFNLWPDIPFPNAGVAVMFVFDGEEFLCDHIGVISDTEIRCEAFMFMGDERITPWQADVKVYNLDSAGDPVPGEDATLVDAVTYEQDEHLPSTTSQRSFLERVFEEFLRLLSVSVKAEVALASHTDWHPDGYIVHFETSYPAVGVTNFSTERPMHTPFDPDRDREMGQEEEYLASEYFWVKFSLVPLTDNAAEGHALWAALVRFGQRVRRIWVPKGPGSTERVPIRFDLDPAPAFGFNTNVGVAEATFSARLGPVPLETPDVTDRLFTWDELVTTAYENVDLTGAPRERTSS